MTQLNRWIFSLFALLVAGSVYAQSFTYQGYLRQSGSPVNSTLSMTFTLFNHPTNPAPGAQVGSPITQSVNVQNGLFTVELNFGSVWDGSDRWLEIRLGSTTLTPRVKINPTPYAIRANTAGMANPIGAAGGDLSGTYPNPTVARLQGRSVLNTAPSNGDVLKWNGTAWAPAADLRDAFWQSLGSDIFYTAGNVGIGTTPSSARLQTEAGTGIAIIGEVTASSGNTWGVYGRAASTSGVGVFGFTSAASGDAYGVQGISRSATGRGVFGLVDSTTGVNFGVYGESRSASGRGVYGLASATTGANYGVYGKTNSPSGYAGYFEGRGYFAENVGIGVTNPSTRLQISTSTGADAVRIDHTGSGRGLQVQVSSDTAIWGVTQTGFAGVDGRGQTRGVYGLATSTVATAYGVQGRTESVVGAGVYGFAPAGNAYGVYGVAAGANGRGVFGEATATSGMVTGVWGVSASPDGIGVYGFATATTGTNYGVYGITFSPSAGYAGYFQGRVHVAGTLSKSAGSFRIDHPLDPENKYLVHSFVESPDMMNIYNGNATTDARGYAVVTLPEWFETLNTDFRYQLTVIGQFAQAIIAQEIRNNQFIIRTDKPNVKVSWQVTGVRKDPYAQQHRIEVEEWKLPEHRGKYLHPELYGQPRERGIHHTP